MSYDSSTDDRFKEREHFLEMLLKVTNDLATSKSLDDALARLVKLTTSTINAERGTIFLNDASTGELFSRIAQGSFTREIRILNTKGIAGWVFSNDEGTVINDAYSDDRFDKSVDMRTGFRTKSILCAPLRTPTGETIGVSQILNKIDGEFSDQDLGLLEAMTTQAAVAIQGNVIVEQIEASRKQELEFLDVVSQISSEIELSPLLQKIMSTITTMLDADRSTLFINDEMTSELYTEVGEGLGKKDVIRFPNNMGIAGAVFQSGEVMNIPYAYADLRFNPSFDKQTGYFTRSVLCVPVINKDGKVIGVSQVLNKHGGVFTDEDEKRLKAFTSQISIGIENAKLFADVQNTMNYNESILSSMSNGVITINEEGKIATSNRASIDMMKAYRLEEVLGQVATEFFGGENQWLSDKLEAVDEIEILPDRELTFAGEEVSLNITLLPLKGSESEDLGSMVMLEDISSEKRMKSTMSRYMDPTLADQLLDEQSQEDLMGGKQGVGTVLFSDIRSFTTITEELGAQGTVKLLNEYFEVMVDVITGEGGMLDKFIGDAIMAIFGTPVPHEDDPDRGVRAAIGMMTSIQEFNKRRAADGKPPIDHGMGVNTDAIVSGNIGSSKRMDYTVIGDGVNLAARLESANKQYGAHILISEYTVDACKGTYRSRKIDNVIVKGKTEPVGVYEVLDYHNDESFPNMIDAVGSFNNGIKYWNEANWDSAIGQFEEALKCHDKDKPSQMFIERCEHMKSNPPEGDWNGVWVLTSK
ncbi:MAG: GAF domain-containing protein [Gammaproteobacteria bacterium]|nr:GAF domain-containing protein [Gammaproteobacteria bacterium]